MRFLKRTASALALGFVLAGGSVVAVNYTAPVAVAQDMSTPEGKLRTIMEMQGYPPGVLNWSSVEESGSDLIAHGVYADVKSYNLGFDTVPLGDMRVSGIEIEQDKYVTAFRAEFTGITVNLAELMATGQKMSQAGGMAAQAGSGFAMMAGYIQGLGYTELKIEMNLATDIDLSSGDMVQDFTVDVADAFDLGVNIGMTGATTAYLDWAKANALKLYLDRSPEAMAEIQKQMADPNGPLATIGFRRYALSFDDQGLMPKLEPQLAQMRPMMLGTNPDGTPKTEMSEADLQAAATQMGGGVMPADKMLPLVKAFYNFVMSPDVIKIAVNVDPALTMTEMQSMSNMAGSAGSGVDWASRVTFEASN
ncbi:MAG: hypothetical protein QM698_09105 [Micropepsaceae bacterium]